MALNTNPFVEGIDPTSTFGGYASVLLQLIRQAIPSSTYGMVLFDTTAPDVTGSNAWRKTCIWLNLTNPNIPTVNVYKEGTSPGWVNTNSIIANGSISTAMIINGAVTLPKLSVSGGAALDLIRVNATTTAFEFVNIASLITVGSIPVGSIITTGIPPGQLRFAGVFGPTTAQWLTPISIINALVDGSINPDLIAPPGALAARSKFLTARTADTFATYRFFEPNVDMLNDTLSGGKLQNGTVSPSKIESAGVPDGYLMGKVAGVPDWVAPPAIPVAPMTREFAFITGTDTLPIVGDNQIFVGTALTQPTVNAQWNAAAGSYTVLNTGYFKITACINARSADPTLVTHLSIILRKNGITVNQTELLEIDEAGLSPSKNFPIVLTHIAKVTVANTDVFTLHGFNNTTRDVDILQYSSLTIERIDTL